MHPDPALLEGDLARLGNALGTAARELSGDRTVALLRGLRDSATALRAGTLPGGRAELARQIAALGIDDIEDVTRAFTHWCHLINSAEEQQRIRALRARDNHQDGVAAAVRALRESGMTADDAAALFDRALVMPVLTAHPTEARRRSVLDHLGSIAELLDLLERPLGGPARRDAEDDVIAEVLSLLGTEESRARKPTPHDELEAVIEVFRRTLFEVTADVYDDLDDALTATYPERAWRVPAFFRWGTWVGGDRDGNPNVTAHVTRSAFERQRTVVLERHLADVRELGRTLSVSARRVVSAAGIEDLLKSLVRDRERMPEVAARAMPRAPHEPWREKLWYIASRLRATLERGDDSYVDAAGYLRDLTLLERGLEGAGFGRLARGLVRRCQRRVEVFGFHLATVDIRQHSAVHESVVDELLGAGGRPGYAALDEAARVKALGEVLARPVTPVWDRTQRSEQAQDLLGTLDMVGRACRELGERACERYIVSFTNSLSDLLEVVFLTRAAGLAPGEVRPVPLLEQLEDLENGGTLARQMLAHPVVRDEIGSELEVMIGYSDSGKQVGYVASAVALRRAQIELTAVAREANVELTVFHGRGGAIGRGGGPAGEAIRAQPVQALRGRVRVTEQGETITARYARPEIAHRDLELTLAAVLRAAADERAQTEAPLEGVLDSAAAAALSAYQRLTDDQERLARYTLAATPIQHVGKQPIGSRPASRKAGFTLSDLRAIPWVFSWNQSRHGIPGWFGLGSALEGLAQEVSAGGVPHLLSQSRFLRALVHNGELAMIRADIDVAREYAALADPEDRAVFAIIEEEHTRTREALARLVGLDQTLADRPHLAASVQRRNPYIDVLSHAQIELIRRLRALESNGAQDAERERLSAAIFTTISGIAAGLQTAG
ncbi:MAG TPA: phosphoenolpyruvate carboxylase [Kofleriaceae bacterium]|nr:phosphoenolpyruvate carboxylase [Kofleriaceae bacterium]